MQQPTGRGLKEAGWLHPHSWAVRQGQHPAWLGCTHQSDLKKQTEMPVAQELQVQAQLPPPPPAPKMFEASPVIQHGPSHLGFADSTSFPPGNPAALP